MAGTMPEPSGTGSSWLLVASLVRVELAQAGVLSAQVVVGDLELKTIKKHSSQADFDSLE